jgi:L-asparagine transporter-like permease
MKKKSIFKNKQEKDYSEYLTLLYGWATILILVGIFNLIFVNDISKISIICMCLNSILFGIFIFNRGD